MAAVVDSTATLWRLVYSTEKLPLASSHLWAGLRRTWWIIEQKANNQVVAFIYEEST